MNRISALILDWAGTTVDFGSFAPTQIFVEAFRQAFDIEITLEEARVPMGLGKWQHIEALGKLPAVDSRWQAKFGRAMTAADIDAIYAAFMPLQIAKVVDFSAPIAGVVDTIATLRAKGLKIGSCSGYPAQVMAKVVELAATNGYVADHVVATDEVPNGRPWPAQALANVIALGIDDVGACVKIDDTVPGILEGRRAGMWTVALVCSGNALGLTWEQYKALAPATLDSERNRIHALFAGSRPHYLIDTISDLPAVISDINQRLA